MQLCRSVIWPCCLIVRERMSHGPCSVIHSFSSASHHMSHKDKIFLTSRGDFLTSLEYSFSVSRSLVSCRSKGRAGRKLQEQTTAAPLYSKTLQDSVVRLKANNVPTAHVHILCGSVAFPRPLAIFQSGKGVSYMRAGSLLCVAVIHVRLHK